MTSLCLPEVASYKALTPVFVFSVCYTVTVRAGLEEAQAGIKIAGRNNNNLRYADNTALMAESEEPLDESERGGKKKRK